MATDQQIDVKGKDVVDKTTDTIKEGSKDISVSLWEEVKGLAKKGAKSDDSISSAISSVIDFGLDDPFKSIHDFSPKTEQKIGSAPTMETKADSSVAVISPKDTTAGVTPTLELKPDYIAPTVDLLRTIKEFTPADVANMLFKPSDIDPKSYVNDGTFHVPGDRATKDNPAEIIKRDVEPTEHTVEKGETLTSIARKHLGKDASDADVHKHAMEIAHINGIHNPNVIHPGQKLEIPGHTANGGIIRVDQEGTRTVHWPDGRLQVDKKDDTGYTSELGPDGKRTEYHYGPRPEDIYTLKPMPDGSYQGTDDAGNKHSKWDDGTEKIEYKNGTGFVRKPDGTGGYDEHHWGPRPEDNFELKKTADGKIEVREKPADRPHESSDNVDIKAEHQKLNELAEKKIKDPEQLAKFQADMARFEERGTQLEELYKKQGMTPEQAKEKATREVAETYKNVERLMEAGDNPKIGITETQRIQLAEQVMSHAATPTSIDQGMHPTCNVNTVETKTFTQNPAEAAKLVADVATTGQYVTKDGKTIQIDTGSLQPHDQAKVNPARDGTRDYASQVFQVTAVNIYYQRNGSIHYEQHEPDPTLTPPDNGERRLDYSKTPPELVKEKGKEYNDSFNPGLTDEQIVEVGKQIADQGDGWYIRQGDSKSAGPVVEVDSPQKLEDKVKEAKEHGQLPIVVKVHSGNEPFYTDSGAGTAGGSGGWHVVTITDYEPGKPGEPGKVTIDNQWGSGADHPKNSEISINDLYRATREPGDDKQIDELRKEVEYNRKEGKVDHYKEIELLRLEKNDGQISEKEFKEKLEAEIKATKADWDAKQAAGTLDGKEYVKQWAKIRDVVHTMPAADRIEVMHIQKQIGFYKDDNVYHDNLAREIADIKKQQQKDVADDKYDHCKKDEFEKTMAEFKKMMDEMPSDADRDDVQKNIERRLK